MNGKAFKYVGKGFPIHDAEQKAAGRAVYAGDIELPGMLYMALLTSSIPSGVIKSMDCSEALAFPGVVSVLTYENTTGKKYNQYRTFRSQALIEQQVIFPREIRYAGEKIAGVIAETESAAREALKYIRVSYDEGIPVYSPSEVFKDNAKSIHPEGGVFELNPVIIGDEPEDPGETEEAALRVSLQRMTHATMETHAAVADYRRASNELTVWAPCQSVFGVRTVLAKLFDLPFNKIRVIKTTMGGSFGCKQETIPEPFAAAGSLATGRPVKVVFTRAQSMVSSMARTPMEGSVALKSKKDGSFVSADIRTDLNAGAYMTCTYSYAEEIGTKVCRVYRTPRIVYNSRVACTNTPVSGGFRGWGAPELATMLELSVDRLAAKLGMDPLALRKKNIVQSGDFDRHFGLSLGDIALGECIDRGAEAFGWEETRAKTGGGRYRYGAGMAIGGHVNGYFPHKQDFGEMTLRMNEDGSFQLLASLHDHGCGSVMEMRIIVAEALGVEPAKVSAYEADTAFTPLDPGCYTSRSSYVTGRAAYECAAKMIALIKTQAGRILNMPPELLVCENGEAYGVIERSKRVSWADIAEISLVRYNTDMRVSCNYVNSSNPGVYGVHFAHVRVDTYTGFTDILKYVAVQDIGQAINPSIVVAQVQGAVQQGAGAALSEEMRLNPRTGRFTDALKDYRLITSAAMPEVQVILVENGGNSGPYGAKSLGEVALAPVAAAVVNAVNHALNAEFTELPVTPDKIMAYLGKQRLEESGFAAKGGMPV